MTVAAVVAVAHLLAVAVHQATLVAAKKRIRKLRTSIRSLNPKLNAKRTSKSNLASPNTWV